MGEQNSPVSAEKGTNTVTYDLSGDYGIGTTKSGVSFLFDLEDYDRISWHSWCLSESGYIHGRENGKTVKMHRCLLNCPEGFVVDHINQNKLDNRKQNLRISTVKQNNANKTYMSNNRSGKIGVYWNRRKRFWTAQIKHDGKNTYIGSFKSYEAAVEARIAAEYKYFGESATHNAQLQITSRERNTD